MRVIPGVCLTMILTVVQLTSADGAKVHHHKLRPVVHSGQPVDPRFPPVLQDQTPRYDDPSRLGSG